MFKSGRGESHPPPLLGYASVYAYRITGDKNHGLSKLVPYASIFIMCFLFSCTFFGCLRPNDKGLAFGEKSLFTGIKVSMQL